MMKWTYAVAFVALFAVAAHATSDYDELSDEEGDARLGYVTVGANGATTLTFNATSIQNAVILGLFMLVLGALLIPLLGALGEDEETGYGYGEQTSGYQSGYEQPSTGYNTYSKRSVEMMGPVLDALSSAYKKYDDEEEK
jgi:hypothetical protein